MTQALATADKAEIEVSLAELAAAEDAAIRNLNHLSKINFLELGKRLNSFHNKELWKHLPLPEGMKFDEFSDYIKDALGSSVGTGRAAMRLTAQLSLPFGSLAKLSRENLERLAKLPPARANDPKWADAAENLSDEEFGDLINKELSDAPSMHIENLVSIKDRVPESIKKLWDRTKTVAAKLHNVQTSEQVYEIITRGFLEAPYDENPAITNEDAYEQAMAVEAENEERAKLEKKQKASELKEKTATEKADKKRAAEEAKAAKKTAAKEKADKKAGKKKKSKKPVPKKPVIKKVAKTKNKQTDFEPDEFESGKDAAAGE